MRLNSTVWPRWQNIPYARRHDCRCASHAAAINLTAQYRQFLVNTFKQYLIMFTRCRICLLLYKTLLRKPTRTWLTLTRGKLYIAYVIRENQSLELIVRLGSIFNWPPCISIHRSFIHRYLKRKVKLNRFFFVVRGSTWLGTWQASVYN